MDPAAGVPEPSCPAAWPTPAVPFLWSRGVWAGVPSRSFMVLWRKRFRKKGEEILENRFANSTWMFLLDGQRSKNRSMTVGERKKQNKINLSTAAMIHLPDLIWVPNLKAPCQQSLQERKNAELNGVICLHMNVLSAAKSKTPFSRCITGTHVQAFQSTSSQPVSVKVLLIPVICGGEQRHGKSKSPPPQPPPTVSRMTAAIVALRRWPGIRQGNIAECGGGVRKFLLKKPHTGSQ